MRIIILIPKLNAAAELALNKLLKRKDLEIKGIVRSDISVFRKNYWKYIRYGIKRSGLFYGAAIGLFAYLHPIGLGIASIFLWNRKKRWLSIDQLIKKHNLWIHDTEDINSKKSIDVLKSWEPDVIVSLYFDQILKNPVIEIPKVAAINMHPGLLPKYRGVWPNFWKLHNHEKFAGATVHHINEKIDDGPILAQTKFPIKIHDTNFSLALKSAGHGTKILIQTLHKMKRGIKIKPLKLKGKPKYYSLPSKTAFNKFFTRGKKLFSILGLWRDFERRY